VIHCPTPAATRSDPKAQAPASFSSSRTAVRFTARLDVHEPGELAVGLDDQSVYMSELAEHSDAGAVVPDQHGDKAVGDVVSGRVGHVDAAGRLGVQRHHEGRRLSAVVWVDRFGHGIDLLGVGVQPRGPCQRRPGHSVVNDRSVSPGDDAISAPSPFAHVLVGHRSEQRTCGSTRRISGGARSGRVTGNSAFTWDDVTVSVGSPGHG
jgi:hypothetical protein